MTVVEGSYLSGVLTSKGLSRTYQACGDVNCATTIGKNVGVQRAIVWSVTTSGRTYELNTRMIDVGSGVVMGVSQREFDDWNKKVFGELLPIVVDDLLSGKPVAKTREKKQSHWGWWAGGAAVVAGAATVSYLFLGATLLDQRENKDPAAEQTDGSSGSVTFTW